MGSGASEEGSLCRETRGACGRSWKNPRQRGLRRTWRWVLRWEVGVMGLGPRGRSTSVLPSWKRGAERKTKMSSLASPWSAKWWADVGEDVISHGHSVPCSRGHSSCRGKHLQIMEAEARGTVHGEPSRGDAQPAGSPRGHQAPHADAPEPLLGLENPCLWRECAPTPHPPEPSVCPSRGSNSVQPCREAHGSWKGPQGRGQVLE